MYAGRQQHRSSAPSRPPWRRVRRVVPTVLAPALAVGLLTACGSDGSGSSGSDTSDSGSGSGSAEGFPVTVDNCGVKTTYDRPPERVVTIHQHPAELMIALGLEESMVGRASPDSAVLPEHRDAYERIPEIAKKEPSFEKALEKEPDLVYGGYAKAFAEKEGRSREAFDDAGIATHLNREYCVGGAVTMKDVYAELRTIGEIFGVEGRAEKLEAELKKEVGDVADQVKGQERVSVFVYDSGDKSAYTAGGKGLGNEIIRLAGGENVFADLDEVFGDASWEQVIERQPEVIAIYDYVGAGSIAKKKEFLLGKPELADVPAIRNERFVVVPLTETLVGVRPPYAVTDVAKALHPKRFQ